VSTAAAATWSPAEASAAAEYWRLLSGLGALNKEITVMMISARPSHHSKFVGRTPRLPTSPPVAILRWTIYTRGLLHQSSAYRIVLDVARCHSKAPGEEDRVAYVGNMR
jgi:hypothetical protein